MASQLSGGKSDDFNLNTDQQLEMSILDSDSDSELISSNVKRNAREYVDKIIKDNETIESVIVSKDKQSDKKLQPIEKIGFDKIDNSNLLYYSNFFGFNEDTDIKCEITYKDLFKEIFIILFFHLCLGIDSAVFNVITIDGIISCIIFYMSYIGVDDKYNFLLKNRLTTLDRYIYYFLLFSWYYLVNFMSWYRFTKIFVYMSSILICPSIMAKIYCINVYKKVRNVLYDGYNKLIQKIVCKQLSKILNLIIRNVFDLSTIVTHEDLIPFYNKFSWLTINKFIATFILACIFNHIDKGGMKVPMMIYKNLYMKDDKYISDDKEYLQKIIVDKKWDKFMDVYTLNRIIRMIMSDDTQNSMLSEQVSMILKSFVFKFNKVLFCWTVMNVTNLTYGVLSFLLFIPIHIEKQPVLKLLNLKPVRYILNTCLFMIVSLMTTEQILILVLCEACYPIIESNLLNDVVKDVYRSLKKGFLSIYYRTRLESVLLSIVFFLLSFYNMNRSGIVLMCLLNLIVGIRFIIRVRSNTPKSEILIESEVNNSIVLEQSQSNNPELTDMATLIESNDALNDSVNQSEELLKLNRYNESNHKAINTILPNILRSRHTKPLNPNEPIPNIGKKNRKPILKKTPDTFSQIDIDVNSIQINDINTDVLLLLRDKMKNSIKHNLLISVLNPFSQIKTEDIFRIMSHLLVSLSLGYISGFTYLHILLLPIMVQNVVDLVY